MKNFVIDGVEYDVLRLVGEARKAPVFSGDTVNGITEGYPPEQALDGLFNILIDRGEGYGMPLLVMRNRARSTFVILSEAARKRCLVERHVVRKAVGVIVPDLSLKEERPRPSKMLSRNPNEAAYHDFDRAYLPNTRFDAPRHDPGLDGDELNLALFTRENLPRDFMQPKPVGSKVVSTHGGVGSPVMVNVDVPRSANGAPRLRGALQAVVSLDDAPFQRNPSLDVAARKARVMSYAPMQGRERNNEGYQLPHISQADIAEKHVPRKEKKK